jgi:mRNA-degrading endonuclease toxin of MazEF toxin-antitoxin module
MRRGDIWTVAGGKDYAGKPRPVVIVQDDSFDATDSITVCPFTTDKTEPRYSACLWNRMTATACGRHAT